MALGTQTDMVSKSISMWPYATVGFLASRPEALNYSPSSLLRDRKLLSGRFVV